MVTRANLSFIKMKKENKEYTRIILSLKYNFGRHFKVFQKFADTVDQFAFLFVTIFRYVRTCFFMYMWVYICIFKCVIYFCV